MAMVSRCSVIVATLLVVVLSAAAWGDQPSGTDTGRSTKRAVDGPTTLGVDTGNISLNVVAGSECVNPLDVVVVSLDISNLSAAINGVQALIHYDTSLLMLNSIASATPWGEVFEDDVAGNVTYSVIIPGGSIIADHTVATLTFTAVAEGNANVSFQLDNPPFLTKLTVASDNSTILPAKFGSGDVFVGLPSCIITADESVCANTSGHAASVPNAGVNATYQWTVSGGTLQAGAGSRSITYSAGSGGNVTLDVIVTDADGCDVGCQKIVTINTNPVAAASNDGPVCSGQSVTLTGGPGAMATYSWSGPGGFASNQQNPIVSPAVAGTYTLTVTDGNGCTDLASTVVVVNANPLADATNSGPVCAGDDVVLFGGPNAMTAYSWIGPGGFGSSQQDATVSPALAGTYSLNVINPDGCADSADTVVVVNPAPACTITADVSTCPRSSGNLASVQDAGAGAVYFWQITGGTIDSQAGNSISYTAGDGPGVTMIVTVSAANGCGSTCQTFVAITSASISATIQLEALGSPANSITRDVSIIITDCSGSPDTRVAPLTVDEFGVGTVVLMGVNLDAEWISVQEGHTLRRLAAVVFDVCGNADVDFTGPNRLLLAGDLNTATEPQDNFVDITDFSILAAAWGTATDPNAATGADVTGDGVQDTADFTAIQVNYFKIGDATDFCPAAALDRAELFHAYRRKAVGRDRIPVRALRIANARRADLNGDGVVDAADIRAFARRHKLPLLSKFRRELDRRAISNDSGR